MVHWQGVSGSHNVYGGLDDFPDNPEAFSSGQPVQDLNFTYVFNVPGLYGYHCTQQGHSATQHGTILVLPAQNVEEVAGIDQFILFPVPVNGELTIELKGSGLSQVDVMSVDGRLLRSTRGSNAQRMVIELNDLAAGRYLIQLVDLTGRKHVRPFVKG
jgi:Secretion system C-terminal sorting domain